MTEEEWFAGRSSDVMLLWLRKSGDRRRSRRKIALFAVACAERVKSFMVEPVTLRGLELCARAAEGEVEQSAMDAYTAEVWESGKSSDLQWPQSQARGLPVVAIQVAFARQGGLSPEKQAMSACGLCAGLYHDPRDRTRGSEEMVAQAALLRDIVGNPFRKVELNTRWRTDTATAIARQMYESRDFSAMPILADALQDAGCDNPDILSHCRDPQQVHVRGCWVVDLVLGKA